MFVPAALRRTILAVALMLAAVGCSNDPSKPPGGPNALIVGVSAPVYPGAKLEASSASRVTRFGASSGQAFSTPDKFDVVYAWYKKNLPGGSERSHATAPAETAVFLLGSGSDRLSVTIATSPLCCKTFFVIAHAKA